MSPWFIHSTWNTLRITVYLLEVFTGRQLFPLSESQSCQVLVSILSLSSKSVDQTAEFLVNWDALALSKHQCNMQ